MQIEIHSKYLKRQLKQYEISRKDHKLYKTDLFQSNPPTRCSLRKTKGIPPTYYEENPYGYKFNPPRRRCRPYTIESPYFNLRFLEVCYFYQTKLLNNFKTDWEIYSHPKNQFNFINFEKKSPFPPGTIIFSDFAMCYKIKLNDNSTWLDVWKNIEKLYHHILKDNKKIVNNNITKIKFDPKLKFIFINMINQDFNDPTCFPYRRKKYLKKQKFKNELS